MKAWPVLGISIVQAFLCLVHWFLYRTVVDFWHPLGPTAVLELRIALITLSISFMGAALLGFRFSSGLVALVYQVAATWLGFLNFFFWAACLCWILDLSLRPFLSVSAIDQVRPLSLGILFAIAFIVSLYGLLNARQIRLRRIPVRLANLPGSWRGRNALLMTDLHLGNINGVRFARRIADRARRLAPDIIFLSGDLFDGTKADPAKIAAPLFELTPAFGVFFVSGNHEEFGGSNHYAEAVREAGFCVLDNQLEEIDRLKIIGVSYSESNYPVRLRSFLTSLNLKDGPASILLQHVPNRLPISDEAGVSLQLCGHTHGGQVFPFNWITRRAFGRFTYGLQRFGELQVYTSSGAGTWGPPMRVGTDPEIVLITFE
ncbi:MAG TPA: metallophosphoesterase [Terracidiphilus sp.]|nr:metallophosphoesterase [Terracidiphilus sp.]